MFMCFGVVQLDRTNPSQVVVISRELSISSRRDGKRGFRNEERSLVVQVVREIVAEEKREESGEEVGVVSEGCGALSS